MRYKNEHEYRDLIEKDLLRTLTIVGVKSLFNKTIIVGKTSQLRQEDAEH